MSKKKEKITASPKNEGASARGFFGTLGRWLTRMFVGASKYETEENKFKVEEIVSPGKAILREFMSRKLAVAAFLIVSIIFIVVLIGPFFNPIDLSYNEIDQKNTPPGTTLLSAPSALKHNCKQIAVGATFSVGLSNDGDVYVWGNTKISRTINLKNIPDEVKEADIVMVGAGTDHAIAISSDGKVYGWGKSNNAQFGEEGRSISTELIYTYAPDIILNGNLNAADIHQLVCGYQVTAIVMNDGSVYMWGNSNNGATNMKLISEQTNVEKIEFCNNAAIALLKDGTIYTGDYHAFDYISIDSSGEAVEINDESPETTAAEGEGETTAPEASSEPAEPVKTSYAISQILLSEYIGSRKVIDFAAAKTSLGFILDDGEVFVTGTAFSGEKDVPEYSGVTPVSIAAGSKHYLMLMSDGSVLGWGSNLFNQATVPDSIDSAEAIYSGSFQNFVVESNGNIQKWGLKGYLMGTDDFGRDVWGRILNGGRMTMTVGAVAVIISSIIGIIVGCLSGYFGGWVDMFLMRMTEVFSAIPFLPFALMLSAVVQQANMAENTRILLIMGILGILSWTGLARLVRAQVLSEREKEFVTAAQAMGVKESKIAFKHILPNIISVILVTMTLDFAGCMLTESSLSYLGFGVRLPRPTWGNMLYGSNNSIVLQQYWWRWVFPALFLGICTICINIVGDTLRDVMDPKSNER